MKILNETLNWNFNLEIENSYIITIKHHVDSEMMAKRCIESCMQVGQKSCIWDAKLIHSATQYGNFERLVQLFFFSTR